MNATVTPAPISPHHLIVVGGRMSEAEYDAERAKLAPNKQTAAIRWEQELAALFVRSHWTQEELAKREGKSPAWITRYLRFGRFLAFAEKLPIGNLLAEGRFRTYWDRTAEHGNSNERIRFRAVLELIEAEEPLRQKHRNYGYTKRIVEKFGDGKWHSLPVIAKHLDADEDEVERSLFGMVKDGRGNSGKASPPAATRIPTIRPPVCSISGCARSTRARSKSRISGSRPGIIKGISTPGMRTGRISALTRLSSRLKRTSVRSGNSCVRRN